MAKKKQRRLKSADEAILGTKPSYGAHNPIPESDADREKEFHRAKHWFYYFENKKKAEETVQLYCKKALGFTPKQVQNLKKIPGWKYRLGVYQTVEMINNGWEGYPLTDEVLKEIHDKLWKCERDGSKIVKAANLKPAKPVIPPAERTRIKLRDTLWAEYDEIIVEGWLNENYTQKFNLYSRFKGHQFKGNAIEPFRKMIIDDYECIKDAYENTCDQAVENYAHISKANKRKILKQFEEIFADMDKLKQSFKATRMPRAKKPKASDRQVEHLKFLQEDVDAKLTSINPILIPGKETLFVFNVKNRTLYQYVTNSEVTGFEVRGTTLYNFDPVSSKCTRLRKPEDMLPIVLQKGVSVIEKEVWKKVTTKVSSPNGRINSDCILLRVL